MAGAALAFGLVGPASARSQAGGRYGGVLVVANTRGEPGSLDPADPSGRSTAALVVYLSTCQRLYDFDAEQKLVPVLAAAAPTISNDKLTYTVALRQGIRFNDGTPLNAQAVVARIS